MKKALLFATLLFMTGSGGTAGQIELGIKDAVFIASPQGGYRALLTFDVGVL